MTAFELYNSRVEWLQPATYSSQSLNIILSLTKKSFLISKVEWLRKFQRRHKAFTMSRIYISREPGLSQQPELYTSYKVVYLSLLSKPKALGESGLF